MQPNLRQSILLLHRHKPLKLKELSKKLPYYTRVSIYSTCWSLRKNKLLAFDGESRQELTPAGQAEVAKLLERFDPKKIDYALGWGRSFDMEYGKPDEAYPDNEDFPNTEDPEKFETVSETLERKIYDEINVKMELTATINGIKERL